MGMQQRQLASPQDRLVDEISPIGDHGVREPFRLEKIFKLLRSPRLAALITIPGYIVHDNRLDLIIHDFVQGILRVHGVVYLGKNLLQCLTFLSALVVDKQLAVISAKARNRQGLTFEIAEVSNVALRTDNQMSPTVDMLIDGNEQRPKLRVFLLCPGELNPLKNAELNFFIGNSTAQFHTVGRRSDFTRIPRLRLHQSGKRLQGHLDQAFRYVLAKRTNGAND